MEAVRRSEHVIRMLRHDLRHLLNNLAMYIDADDKDSAKKLISGFVANVDSTAIKHYCENPTVNYILSDCDAKCAAEYIVFSLVVALDTLNVDEIMLSSILSNSLDNAINAQK